MRTYGRIPKTLIPGLTFDGSSITFDDTLYTMDSTQAQSSGMQWVQVDTDSNGYNDLVWLTTLIQTLKLNLNESPFYATYGIPAQQSVVQQVFPDYYVALTQQAFSQYFASLLISKQSGTTTPTYLVNVTTHQGVKINANVAVPT